MKRVTGLGGVFFKCKDPKAMMAWYQKHLGIDCDAYGGLFIWEQKDPEATPATTAWSPFKEDTDYFAPSEKNFMFNYRVADLHGLLKVLKEEGVEIVGEPQEFEYGKFGWIMDPEGNKVELWEPIDKPLIDFRDSNS